MPRSHETNPAENLRRQIADELTVGAREYVAQFGKVKFPDIHPSEELLAKILLRLSFIEHLYNSSHRLKKLLSWSSKSIGIGRKPGSKRSDPDRFIVYVCDGGPTLYRGRARSNLLSASNYRRVLESQMDTEDKKMLKAFAQLTLVEIMDQIMKGVMVL